MGNETIRHAARKRFRAYTDVLFKHRIPTRCKNYFSGDYREAGGYQAVNILLLAGDLPEILVCTNDTIAIGVIRTKG